MGFVGFKLGLLTPQSTVLFAQLMSGLLPKTRDKFHIKRPNGLDGPLKGGAIPIIILAIRAFFGMRQSIIAVPINSTASGNQKRPESF